MEKRMKEKDKMAKKTTPLKKDHYYVAKYKGNNGDLIVGRIKSVRSNGEIVLVNLLTEKNSVKMAHVLLERNKRVSKAHALEVVDIHNQTGSRAKAKMHAIGLPEYGKKKKPEQVPLPTIDDTKHRQISTLMSSLDALMGAVEELLGAVKELLTVVRSKSSC
jgi:hypothetical protein